MSIKIWEAVRYDRVLSNSRTKPLVLECELRSGDGAAENPVPAPPPSLLLAANGRPLGESPQIIVPGHEEPADSVEEASCEFVVKSIGHPEVIEATLLKELFGNALARAFGIQTPTPALIYLSDAFVRNTQPQLPPEADIVLREGYGVGCEYLPRLTPIPSDFKLSSDLMPDAARIYTYDMLTANPDRRVNNPNCGYHGEGLLAYDFESAFSFLYALLNPPPWQFSALTFPHVFRAPLARVDADWQPFVDCLLNINETNLNEIVSGWPSPWLANCPRIIEHILAVKEEANRLPMELATSLRLCA